MHINVNRNNLARIMCRPTFKVDVPLPAVPFGTSRLPQGAYGPFGPNSAPAGRLAWALRAHCKSMDALVG